MSRAVEKEPEVTHTKVKTAIGELTLVKRNGVLSGIYQEGQRNHPQGNFLGAKVHKREFVDVISQVDDYFSGIRTQFDLALYLEGTEFLKKIWLTLQSIPYGTTISYAGLAKAAGLPSAIRAVASAVGANPITVVIPCHRVVSENGDIKYSANPIHKIKLLEVESENAFV